jgi:hypothetical protein
MLFCLSKTVTPMIIVLTSSRTFNVIFCFLQGIQGYPGNWPNSHYYQEQLNHVILMPTKTEFEIDFSNDK